MDALKIYNIIYILLLDVAVCPTGAFEALGGLPLVSLDPDTERLLPTEKTRLISINLVTRQGLFTSFGEGALALFVGKICAIFAFLGKYVNWSPIMS